MTEYNSAIQIRWSDLDPNFHVRHSVYYDWGALCRINYLDQNGLTIDMMQKLHFGPILFREEAVFRKEIRATDNIRMTLELGKAKNDISRWTIRHRIFKGEDVLCAILTVDGAWMDIVARKLAAPPPDVQKVFGEMPKAEGFEWQ